MYCNTSADQFVNLSLSRVTTTFIGLHTQGDVSNTSAALPLSAVIPLWVKIEGILLEILAPRMGNSLFYPVVTQNNLSFLSIEYEGTSMEYRR